MACLTPCNYTLSKIGSYQRVINGNKCAKETRTGYLCVPTGQNCWYSMNDNGTSHIAERVWWLNHPCTHFWIRNIYFRLSEFHCSLLLIYFRYDLNTTCSHHEEWQAAAALKLELTEWATTLKYQVGFWIFWPSTTRTPDNSKFFYFPWRFELSADDCTWRTKMDCCNKVFFSAWIMCQFYMLITVTEIDACIRCNFTPCLKHTIT